MFSVPSSEVIGCECGGPEDAVLVCFEYSNHKSAGGRRCNVHDTICVIQRTPSRTPVIGAGAARLNPADEPNTIIGMKVAFERALGNGLMFSRNARRVMWRYFWSFTETLGEGRPFQHDCVTRPNPGKRAMGPDRVADSSLAQCEEC